MSIAVGGKSSIVASLPCSNSLNRGGNLVKRNTAVIGSGANILGASANRRSFADYKSKGVLRVREPGLSEVDHDPGIPVCLAPPCLVRCSEFRLGDPHSLLLHNSQVFRTLGKITRRS